MGKTEKLFLNDYEEQKIRDNSSSFLTWGVISLIFLLLLTIFLQVIGFLVAYKDSGIIKYSTIIGFTPYIGPTFIAFKLLLAKSVSCIPLFLVMIPCIVMAIFSATCFKKRSVLNSQLESQNEVDYKNKNDSNTEVKNFFDNDNFKISNEVEKEPISLNEKIDMIIEEEAYKNNDDIINPVLSDFVAIAKQVEQAEKLDNDKQNN